jgi:predicted house-cleaning noncanonical NTP pyrophosphatase (MazG superfamily)
MPPLEVFRPVQPGDQNAPKARCVVDYITAGLPHADLWILHDASVLKGVLDGRENPALLRDLGRLAEVGAVMRTDYLRADDADFEMMLPRTDSSSSRDQFAQFLHTNTKKLVEAGVAIDDIVFLAHSFLPADAAAWSLAAPTSSQVRIDATHGLPDGLLYYSHDSYVVDLRTQEVSARVRCKSPIIVCDDDGSWHDQQLGAPWDWRQALTDREALEIAQASKLLADSLGRAVETMFFVRAHIANSSVETLPWVHRTEDVELSQVAATESHFASRSVEVRSGDDLRVLTEALRQASDGGERLLVQLKPRADVLHEAWFIKQLIEILSARLCVVELPGSTLSHVYYELQRAGLQVRAVDPIEPLETTPMAFDKLVRDLVPENIASKGERVKVYTATGDELKRLLKRKLIEEALEVAQSSSAREIMEELGDVVDVLAALCAVLDTDLQTVASWAEQKRDERGGFERGQVLVETRDLSLEEAIAEQHTFPVAPKLAVEVERSRGSESGLEAVHLSEDASIPLRPDALLRLAVESPGIFDVILTSTGVRLRRRRSEPIDPDQLVLRL